MIRADQCGSPSLKSLGHCRPYKTIDGTLLTYQCTLFGGGEPYKSRTPQRLIISIERKESLLEAGPFHILDGLAVVLQLALDSIEIYEQKGETIF